MTFETKAINELPQAVKFGKEASYSVADLEAAAKSLKANVAVSNGTKYASKQQARNKATTLRKNLEGMKNAVPMRTAIEKISDTEYKFWIVPTNK